MVDIQISDMQQDIQLDAVDLQFWEQFGLKVCQLLQVENKIVSIVFVDNDTICKLNTQYRNKPTPTDVLSFTLSDLTSEEKVLGEIIIATPIAEAQATEYYHTLRQEVAFLILHGILHLVGYDHDDEHRGVMREKEKELAQTLGLL